MSIRSRDRRGAGDASDLWWRAQAGKVHDALLPYVEKVERVQAAMFDRFVKLAALYDPYSPAAPTDPRERAEREAYGVMQENVIASNCDAIAGTIAATEVRARVLTDGADWSVQRTARQLDWYGEDLSKLLDLDAKGRIAFHAGALKGTGLVELGVNAFDELFAEVFPADEAIVEDAIYRGGLPSHFQRRMMVSRDVLLAEYPQHRKAIEDAQTGGRAWKRWAGYRPIHNEEIVVIKGWRLPLGPKGHAKYVPGRRVVCIDGHDLLDEEYHKPFYPIARFIWTERPGSWYGIGGAERIIGHQRKLNRRNFQGDRLIDQYAFPTTWVRLPDANIAVRTMNRYAIGVYKADKPVTEIPPAISPDMYRDKTDTRALSFEEFGQSRMQATAMKPAGLDSGVALREHRDQTTQRFASQEKGHEQLKLDMVFLAIDAAKDLGAKAPVIARRTKFGSGKVPWSKVNMVEVRSQLAAAAALGRTPAGRTQFVMEMAQAGIISQESARRLLMPHSSLDVEAELSLYIAAAEDIDRTIDEIEDGATDLVPEPYQNLEMGIWRMQRAYLKDRRTAGAPEEVLEALRQWIVMAEYELGLGAAAQAPAAAGPGMSAAPGPGMAGELAPIPMEQPTAALSPQAMQLRAA